MVGGSKSPSGDGDFRIQGGCVDLIPPFLGGGFFWVHEYTWMIINVEFKIFLLVLFIYGRSGLGIVVDCRLLAAALSTGGD